MKCFESFALCHISTSYPGELHGIFTQPHTVVSVRVSAHLVPATPLVHVAVLAHHEAVADVPPPYNTMLFIYIRTCMRQRFTKLKYIPIHGKLNHGLK